MRVAVVGAGASGLVCSIRLSSDDYEVVLFDKNSICGKKILVTGNGRCNYWNGDQSIYHYHSSTNDRLLSIITSSVQDEVLSFFSSLGVVPNIKNGWYYPYSNQASSIQKLLEEEAKRRGVVLALDNEVVDVKKENNHFFVYTKEGYEVFDYLVIATGSFAGIRNLDGVSGYSLAEKFGHHIVPVRPALVPLITKGSFLKDWSGVRTSCVVSLYEDCQFIKKEEGEIQLTDYGVSGICVFNLSRYVGVGIPEKEEKLVINFLPFLEDKSDSEVYEWFMKRGEELSNYSILSYLEGILPYKLIIVLLKVSHISRNSTWSSLSEEERNRLISCIVSFPLEVVCTKDIISSQVCSGGVSLNEVTDSLESKLVDHLYFTGEVLDVDGDCGGYNLGFSFMSGIIVSDDIRG